MRRSIVCPKISMMCCSKVFVALVFLYLSLEATSAESVSTFEILTCQVSSSNREELKVPNVSASWREIVHLLPNGSMVDGGDLIARFFQEDVENRLSASIAHLEDEQTQIDLEAKKAINDLHNARVNEIQARLRSQLANIECGIPEGIFSELRSTIALAECNLSLSELRAQEYIVADREEMNEYIEELNVRKIAILKSIVDDLQSQHQALSVRSNQSGMFVRHYDKRTGRVFDIGDVPEPGAVLATVIDEHNISLVCFVSTSGYHDIKRNEEWYLGIKEIIRPSGESFQLRGGVHNYLKTPLSRKEIRYYELELLLDEPNLLSYAPLLPGMTVGVIVPIREGFPE